MPVCEAVIFDRDGVLTDFDLLGAEAFFSARLPIDLEELIMRWNRWGTIHGFPRDLAEEEAFFREFWTGMAGELKLGDQTLHELITLDYTSFVHPFDDAAEELRRIRDCRLQIGVLSNFSLASLETSLRAVGLARYIDVFCAATAIGYSKPQPEAYLETARQLGVDPSRCLFVDDERACVAGAKAVGMQAYLLDRSAPGADPGAGVLNSLKGFAALACS